MHDSAWRGVKGEAGDSRRAELSWARGEASAAQQRPSASASKGARVPEGLMFRIIFLFPVKGILEYSEYIGRTKIQLRARRAGPR